MNNVISIVNFGPEFDVTKVGQTAREINGEGSKYTYRQDIKDIAKCVRADIKKAFGTRIKASVTISRYSGGQSLNVSFIPTFRIWNPEFIAAYAADPHAYMGSLPPRYTQETTDVIAEIESIVAAYNYDRSDTQTDYFCVNFYGHVRVDWQYEASSRKEALALA